MRLIDSFLNQITMYRLMLYYLILLVLAAVFLGFFGLVPFSPISILASSLFLVFVCVGTNKILAFIFKAPVNIESSYITALILSLIITPPTRPSDFAFLLAAGLIATAGKYIFFFERKHIFNPAAAAVATTSVLFGWYASWWVGTTYMFLFLALGVLIVKKIKRWEMILAFLTVFLVYIFLRSLTNPILMFQNAILESPLLFFAFVMLSEPQTSPTVRSNQIVYGAVSGFGSIFFAPEWALMIGNLFAYLFGMKKRLVLKLEEKKKIGSNIYDFTFSRPKDFKFIPGQYLEWTLEHEKVDTRGNRRYFTIASSPTEDEIHLGIRIEESGSSFKRALLSLNKNQTVIAGQLSGNFVLPKDASKKLIFIAGGIGITPFRAMIKCLIDRGEVRDIVLFYAVRTKGEFVYRDIFNEAKKFGLKTGYLLDRLNAEKIKESVPDFRHRTFYLSGPHKMVEGYKAVLKQMKVHQNKIKTDYFPGYA